MFPTDGVDREELHRFADEALYVRKHGRADPKPAAQDTPCH